MNVLIPGLEIAECRSRMWWVFILGGIRLAGVVAPSFHSSPDVKIDKSLFKIPPVKDYFIGPYGSFSFLLDLTV